jgi:hypothetical protein
MLLMRAFILLTSVVRGVKSCSMGGDPAAANKVVARFDAMLNACHPD